jgi:hypothetical protein
VLQRTSIKANPKVACQCTGLGRSWRFSSWGWSRTRTRSCFRCLLHFCFCWRQSIGGKIYKSKLDYVASLLACMTSCSHTNHPSCWGTLQTSFALLGSTTCCLDLTQTLYLSIYTLTPASLSSLSIAFQRASGRAVPKFHRAPCRPLSSIAACREMWGEQELDVQLEIFSVMRPAGQTSQRVCQTDCTLHL